MYEHRSIGMNMLQIQNTPCLEFLVHDACTIPQQDIGPRLTLHVIAEMPIRRPNDRLILRGQMLSNIERNAGSHHPVGARLDRCRGVGIHHHLSLRVGITESREFIDRATLVQRAGCLESRHQHALVRSQDLGRLAHKPDPCNN